jgi:hypothetical protein
MKGIRNCSHTILSYVQHLHNPYPKDPAPPTTWKNKAAKKRKKKNAEKSRKKAEKKAGKKKGKKAEKKWKKSREKVRPPKELKECKRIIPHQQ